MSMEEVNEKFPLTKYKTWRSNRAEEGLPTAGGITASSRPASIRDVALESKEIEPKSPSIAQTTTAVTEDEKATPEHGKPEEAKEASGSDTQATEGPKTAQSQAAPSQTPIKNVTTNDEGDEEDDHIQTAVPAEQLPDPGDACAICIDTIEDDDDVRGLHCGHAFHASCVDPWLTSRRACCPLCKADYYVPKPRPEGADAEEARRRGQRLGDGPVPPQFAFIGGGRRPTLVLPGRFMSIVYDERDRYGFPRVVREPRPPRLSRSERRQQERDERQRQMSSATTVNAEPQTTDVQQQPASGWRQRLANVRIPNSVSGLRGNRGNEAPEATMHGAAVSDPRTPAQLEAGRT
jgi:Ring finger domain